MMGKTLEELRNEVFWMIKDSLDNLDLESMIMLNRLVAERVHERILKIKNLKGGLENEKDNC